MTAIAGFVHNGEVWIGGDSAGSDGWGIVTRSDQKVFRRGDMIFGFTSSFRMGQLLRYKLAIPKVDEGQDLYEFMVTSFVDSVRECLKAGGYARKENEAENAGFFLVGFRGRLFKVEPDYQVAESADGYDACGAGQNVALGALHATSGMEPGLRMSAVLTAAEHHSATVRGPFIVLST